VPAGVDRSRAALHRGQNARGLCVVAAACAAALGRGELVLYQTLLTNRGALGIARRLGFEPYATLVALRLAAGARPTPEL
jgi:hypothetical protein